MPRREGTRGSGQPLLLFERTVAAQVSALADVPLNMPVPREVLALLAAPPPSLGEPPAPADFPRLAKLAEDVQGMIDNLALRQRELAGRAATVRAARRAGEAQHLLDWAG
ncbi:MAG TPA: hypothetical protein VK425_00345 [Acidimicrobiales bacterium]|nr:hypothetical protein [Acidimicrobiales bacterium]